MKAIANRALGEVNMIVLLLSELLIIEELWGVGRR